MEDLKFKMTKKDNYTYLVKNGRKTSCKINAVKDGFYCLSKVFYTLNDAIIYVKNYLHNTYNAFGDKYTINLILNF